ncbi:MAG: HSP20 family protein [Halothiobacillaceae bacterium]|nr:MAG: HSP20 family protein [Halothiobacillaceae bacterium]
MAVRYDPWTLMNELQSELNRSFETRRSGAAEAGNVVTSDWIPPVDIREEKERFVILADLPGVDPKGIEVHMEKGVLTIKGVRNGETEEQKAAYKRTERARGSFYRRFSLPDSADSEGITATTRLGVLEVTIPKHEKVQSRKITVEGE